MENDRKSELKEAYDQGWASWGPWQASVKTDLKAYGGDPWSSKDKLNAKMRGVELMTIPQLRRCVKWVTGYEREHRLAIIYDPQEGGDEQTASQLSAAAMWSMQLKNGYNTISDGFEGALKTGINLINLYNDRNFNTRFGRFMYNQFILDPTFSRVDLEDCQWGIMRKYITKSQAKMLLPGKESEIDNLEASGAETMFSNYPQPKLYGEKLHAFDEFQQRTVEKRKIIILKPTMEEIVFKGSKRELEELMRIWFERGIPPEMISVVERWEPTIRVTDYLDGQEVINAIDPFGIDDFSFTPIVCYLDAEQDSMVMKLQGLIHGLVDSQKASDKRMMSIISWMESQAGAGMDFEENTLVDERDSLVTGSGHPRQFKKNAIRESRYRDRTVPSFPPGMLDVWNSINQGIPKIVNINEEMFGMPANGNLKVAGVLAKLRVGAGLIGLRDLFDNRGVTIKMIGRKMNRLIQQYPPSKIERIINQKPTPAFYNRMFGKYDCVVAEGMISDTQRAMAYAEAVALKELGVRLQDPCPLSWKHLLKMAPIQQKSEVLKEVEAQEKQRAVENQKQQQIQNTMQQLAIQKLQTDMQNDRMLAEQQRTAAIENTTEAAYDKVATMEKIQNMREKSRQAGESNAIKLLEIQANLEIARMNRKGKE